MQFVGTLGHSKKTCMYVCMYVRARNSKKTTAKHVKNKNWCERSAVPSLSDEYNRSTAKPVDLSHPQMRRPKLTAVVLHTPSSFITA